MAHSVRVARAAVLAAVLLAGAAHADVDTARAKGLKWLVQTQKGDGSFAGPAGLEVQATAAAVEALLAGGLDKSPQQARALAWLANAKGESLDARAWQAQALAAAGRDASGIGAGIRDERKNQVIISGAFAYSNTAFWGPFPDYAASIHDTVQGYGALRGSGVSYTNDTSDMTITVVCHLVPAQLTASPWNGAWPYALPQTSQPGHVTRGSLVTTAAVLYEFKEQRQAGRFPNSTTCSKPVWSTVDTAMVNAKTWLIAQANGDGGFAERSPQTGALEASSPVATALALRALALFAAEGDSAASTAVANGRTWLETQQNADGSWRGDPFVTARVLAALPAATGAQLADADNDGLTDVVEQALGTQVAQADAQGVLSDNANAVAGVTATSFAASAILGEAFAHTLSAGGGAGPYSYALVNGSLPQGLTLAVDGQITGIPEAVGSYAFDYQVTDAGGATALVIGRIDVVTAAVEDGDVPLPGWALLALGGALLGAMRRRAA